MTKTVLLKLKICNKTIRQAGMSNISLHHITLIGIMKSVETKELKPAVLLSLNTSHIESIGPIIESTSFFKCSSLQNIIRAE